MKKNILTILLSLGILILTGCNYDTYHTAICNMEGEYKKIKIKSWTSYYKGEQIQLEDYEGNVYLFPRINCTLIK